MWVPTWTAILALLNGGGPSGSATTSLFSSCSIGLLRGPYAPTNSSTFSDAGFLEANYNGYKRQATPSISKGYIGQGHFGLCDLGSLIFQPTGSDTVNTIYGQFLTGSTSTTLLGVEMFNTPVPLPDSSHALVTNVLIGLDGLANYGMSLVSN